MMTFTGNEIGMILLLSIILLLSACSSPKIGEITSNAVNQGENIVKTGRDLFNDTKDIVSDEDLLREKKMAYLKSFAVAINETNLSTIDLKYVQSHDDFGNMIDQINILVELSNKNLGTEISFLTKDNDAYENYIRAVHRYTPLVDNYNGIIEASRNFDRNNEDSANQLISKVAGLGAEAFVIFGGFLHKAVFTSVGELSRAVGITKLTSLCSTCVSATMSSMYWTGKNFIVNGAGIITEMIVK